MAATLESIWSKLQSNKFDPIYFLCGEESYYIDLIEDYIAEHALAPHEKDFNYSIFYGKDTDPVNVLNEAKQYPTFAEKRLIIIREAQEFKAKDWEILEKYFEQPVESTILICAHKNKTLDKRTKTSKTIEKNSVYFESKKISDEALPEWISAYVKKLDFKISTLAATIIAESLGNDLSRISKEIDKLSVMLSDKSEITPEIIEKYIGISKEYNVTEFNKAITSKDFSKAMRMVLYFEKNPKAGPLIQILAFLYNHFSKLFVIQKSADLQSASVAMGFKGGWMPDDLKYGVKYYSPDKTQEIIQLLCLYDAKAKGLYATNNSSDADLLKELVYQIMK